MKNKNKQGCGKTQYFGNGYVSETFTCGINGLCPECQNKNNHSHPCQRDGCGKNEGVGGNGTTHYYLVCGKSWLCSKCQKKNNHSPKDKPEGSLNFATSGSFNKKIEDLKKEIEG